MQIEDAARLIQHVLSLKAEEQTLEVEVAGTGCPTEFSSVFGEFKVVLRNGTATADLAFDRTHAAESILTFCAEPRSRGYLLRFTGLTLTYMMNVYVQPLIDSGRLRLSLPGKPKSKLQKHYSG